MRNNQIKCCTVIILVFLIAVCLLGCKAQTDEPDLSGIYVETEDSLHPGNQFVFAKDGTFRYCYTNGTIQAGNYTVEDNLVILHTAARPYTREGDILTLYYEDGNVQCCQLRRTQDGPKTCKLPEDSQQSLYGYYKDTLSEDYGWGYVAFVENHLCWGMDTSVIYQGYYDSREDGTAIISWGEDPENQYAYFFEDGFLYLGQELNDGYLCAQYVGLDESSPLYGTFQEAMDAFDRAGADTVLYFFDD